MKAKVLLLQHDVRRLCEAQTVMLALRVGKKAGKRIVSHHHLHPTQQRQVRRHRILQGNRGGGFRLVSRYYPAGQHVAQCIGEH